MICVVWSGDHGILKWHMGLLYIAVLINDTQTVKVDIGLIQS